MCSVLASVPCSPASCQLQRFVWSEQFPAAIKGSSLCWRGTKWHFPIYRSARRAGAQAAGLCPLGTDIKYDIGKHRRSMSPLNVSVQHRVASIRTGWNLSFSALFAYDPFKSIGMQQQRELFPGRKQLESELWDIIGKKGDLKYLSSSELTQLVWSA